MISKQHLNSLLEISRTLSADASAIPEMDPSCQDACSKLFEKIWKLSGRPEGDPVAFGKSAFFNQNGVTTTAEIRLRALQYTISKNNILYLESAIGALKEGDLDLSRNFLMDLSVVTPSLFEEIERLCPGIMTTASLENTQAAIEKVFIVKKLDQWVSKANPGEERETARIRILGYLEDPEETKLDLSNLSLTGLPAIFSAGLFRKTINLDLKHNSLTNLPLMIGCLVELTVLDLRHNNLKYIPETIGRLLKLNFLHLENNQITRLPASLARLGQLKNLFLNANPIAQNLAIDNWSAWKKIIVHQNAILISIFFYEPTRFAVFPSLVNDKDQLTKIIVWLGKLRDYRDSLSTESQVSLTLAVREFLETAEQRSSFRSVFIGIIDEASHSCIDGLTLSLLHLRKAKIQDTLDFSNLGSLASVLSKIVILNKLEEIAIEKIRTAKEAVDIEIASGRAPTEDELEHGHHISVQRVEREYLLRYPAALKEEFDLPVDVSESMFAGLTRVTDKDIEDARGVIRALLSNPDLMHTEMIKLSAWETALQLHDPQGYKALREDETRTAAMVAFSRSLIENPTLEAMPKEYISLFQAIQGLGIGATGSAILAVITQIEIFQGTDGIIARYNAEKDTETPSITLPLEGGLWRGFDSLLFLSIVKEFLFAPEEDDRGASSYKKIKR